MSPPPDAASARKVLASAPVGSIVRDLALAISNAQRDLDAASIESTLRLASTDSSVKITDVNGEEHERTLLSLGFTPTFYSFSTVDIEVAVDTRIVESQETGVAGSLELSREGTTAVGMTLSAEHQRKFGMESSGSTRINAQLISLPASAQLLNLLQGLGENE